MRARRRRVKVVRAGCLVAVRGEDGLEFGPEDGILIFIVVFFAALGVFILLAGRTWGLSIRGLGTGSRSGGRLGWRLALISRTSGVVHVEIFKDVHITRRPNDPLVESGPPLAVPIWASALQESAVDGVLLCLTR